MLMPELIVKKRNGETLTGEEIKWMIDRYTDGVIPDYQMSAMLMAIYFNGMDKSETLELTQAMLYSGGTMDLSSVSGVKADKHSTGGVGDKTSLVLCPMVACCGVKMAKMSGRGLGHTGGTIDKLDSFPGFSSSLSDGEFLNIVDKVGFAIAGQTADLAPADKKLYALRDVTGTVDSRPLIVGSIMSKKLAAGADIIMLDVKCGSGSFMKSEEDAFKLASEMVEVGRMAGKKIAAVVTDMDEPLGNAVGNALEVKEAIAVLKGEYAGELLELCLVLGSNILLQAETVKTEAEARTSLLQSIKNGSALRKLAEFVRAQRGDDKAVFDTGLLPSAPVILEVPSVTGGFINHITADKIGLVSLFLGGGRTSKESVIDLSVGIVLMKKVGDRVSKGESIAAVHAPDRERGEEAAKMILECFDIASEKPEKLSFIKGVVN